MAEDAGDKEKSESRFLDVSEESISVSFLVRVAKLHVLSQWLQLELRTPYHGIWLPLNHWLDQASGCISTLGIQRGRGVRRSRHKVTGLQGIIICSPLKCPVRS